MDYGKQAAAAVEKVKSLDTKLDTSNLIKAQEDARTKIAAITDAKKRLDTIVDDMTAKKRALDADMDSLSQLTQAAQSAARDEYNGMLRKLNIEGVSIGNVAEMVFGPEVTGRLFNGMYWLDRINKTIPPNVRKNISIQKNKFGSRGYDIEFPLREMAYPSFRIGVMRISCNEKAYADEALTSPFIAGEIRDITSDQDHAGMPMTAKLSVMVPAYRNAAGDVSAMFDRRGGASIDSYKITVKDMPIADLVLGNGANGLPMRMRSCTANADAGVTFSSNRSDAVVRVALRRIDLEFNTNERLDAFSGIVRDTLSSVKNMTLTLAMKSENGRVETSVDSDLDNQLAARLKKLFGDKADELTRYLEKEFDRVAGAEQRRVLTSIGADRASITAGFGAQEKAVFAERDKLDQKKKEIENNLNAYQNELNRKADEGKKKAESEAKNKATDLLKQNKIPGF
ncbi:MAG: hypothetical protein AABZ39_11435 [Spirochaetota bacterium]